jgi:hypothetical protein
VHVRSALVVPAFLLTILTAVPSSFAQENPTGAYAGGGLAFLTANGPSGESRSTYSKRPGGATYEWHLAAGAFLTPRVSLEGGLASSGLLSSLETTHYGVKSIEERRDTALFVTTRIHLSRGHRVEPELLAGVRFVQAEGTRTQLSTGGVSGTTPVSNPTPRALGTSWSTQVLLGFDLRVGGPKVALVPGVRVSFALHDEPRMDSWPEHDTAWNVSAGVALRMRL